MNLTRLFDTQKALDAAIVEKKGLEGRDVLSKKILALQVELGELANEWRGFKFWSANKTPRTQVLVDYETCDGTGDLNYEYVQEEAEGKGGHEYIDCEECSATGKSGFINPLLEEYVDCLHFILSLGLELHPAIGKMTVWNQNHEKEMKESESKLKALTVTTDLFNSTFKYVVKFYESQEVSDFGNLFSLFIILGRKLGFTLEQIESAYFEKNATNHERQNNGY